MAVQAVCFNPRPRMGGDIIIFGSIAVTHVSIHAPAWGATKADIDIIKENKFQSTPPHGGRLLAGTTKLDEVCFNPRPRMGGD